MSISWDDDPAPRPRSHGELAIKLVHEREFEESTLGPNARILSAISEKNLRLLIDFAFYTSMASEEGRYSRFRIAFRKASEGIAVPFTGVVLSQIDDLRKLAPICGPDCALLVCEREEHLYCEGLALVGLSQLDNLPGQWLRNAELDAPPTILFEIKGPGHLAVSTGRLCYEFRDGSIRQLTPVFHLNVPRVNRWVDDLREYISEHVAQRFGDCTKASSHTFSSENHVHANLLNSLYTHVSASPVPVVLSRMLRVAVEARHGGAFVIIPSDSREAETYKIESGHSAEGLDLAQDGIEFLCASADAVEKAGRADHDQALNRWSFWKSKMLADADAMGSLSSVDGCVVLNRRMQLCRFGAKIRVSDDDAKAEQRDFVNAKTGRQIDYEDFMDAVGGTRHQSAARLCKAFDDFLVFVVSQDGNLTAFYSDANTATGVRCVLPFDFR